MTTHHDDNGEYALMPGNDPLDSLLRDWHAENAASAAAQRDKLMSAVRAAKNTLTPALRASSSGALSLKGEGAKSRLREQSTDRSALTTLTPALSLKGEGARPPRFARFTPAIAASLAFAATLGLLFTTVGPRAAQARADVIMAPDGGRLDAVNARGELIGPCPLKHTDVHVDVSGSFARVTLQQRYGNPYADKIEAVYTFPMSHRAAVDRMTMTIGDRIVVGEVKEREAARATYEAAKSAGHAAALLEQERPNIFTQSVANIEPGVEILVEISYVELLEARDGLFGFTFPMVVAPRYIPGGDDSSKALPGGLQHREGLNLLAPGTLTITANGDTLNNGVLTAEVIYALITDAIPIETPPAEYWASHYPTTGQPALWHQFEIGYMDGQREAAVLYTGGLGQINGRWFYIDAGSASKPAAGTGFANGTAQVHDAARITPQPVKPPTRAGHDISITVNIDTGGPGITDLKSELHAVQQNWGGMRTDGSPSQVAVSLNDVATIPNQDFVLHWRQTADTITEQVFTHAGAHGGFITLILNPPARVENTQAVPRELVFVLDTSGSMQGFPIQKAKEVMSKAIAALRPQDTFNLITFAGDTNILWDTPQPVSPDKLAEAQQFLDSREGHGGTEMMNAIEAALTVKPEQRQLAEGEAAPVRIVCFMTDGEVGNDMAIIDAVKKNAATTRVFSFGIGNSVNRYLLDGIAKAGRGAAEYVLLSEGADEKVASFSQRIQSPVLMDVQMQFSGDIEVVDAVSNGVDAMVEAGNSSSPSRPGDQAAGGRYSLLLPDLYDVSPIIVHARYTKGGKGSVTLRGNAGDGPYEKTLSLDLPEAKAEHDVIATLWAREKVEQIMNRDLAAAQAGNFPEELKRQVIDLGETFQIMTQYTSFVAVENLRVTIGGQPRLVSVPIELPEGQSWEGTMGEAVNKWADEVAPQDLVGRTVDMWSLVRANNTTPKQFNAPSQTDTSDPAQDTSAYYDFLTEVHLSYAYQYSEGRPPIADEIAPLDASRIPPEVLTQVVNEIVSQTQPEVTRTFSAELAANDEILARQRGQLGQSLAILESENDPADMVDMLERGSRVAGSRWQGFHGEPIADAGDSAETLRRSVASPSEGAETLYFMREQTATSAGLPIAPVGQPGQILHGLEKQSFPPSDSRVAGAELPVQTTGKHESAYWFDTRSTEGRTVAAAGRPTTSTPPRAAGMPPPPNSSGVVTNQFGVAENRPHVFDMLGAQPAPAEVRAGLRKDSNDEFLIGARFASPRNHTQARVGFVAMGQGGTPFYDVNNSISQSVQTMPDAGGAAGATTSAYNYDSNGDGIADMTLGTPVLGDISGLGRTIQPNVPDSTSVRLNLDIKPKQSLDTLSAELAKTRPASAYAPAPAAPERESYVAMKGVDALLLEVVDDADPVDLGQEITYTITVTNQGAQPGSKIALYIVLPEQVRPIRSAGGPAKRDGQTIYFAPQATLEPKKRMQRMLTVRPVMAGDYRITAYMSSAEMKGADVMETESSSFDAVAGQSQLSPEAIADIDRQWIDGTVMGDEPVKLTKNVPASDVAQVRPSMRRPGDTVANQMLLDQLLVRTAALAQSGRLEASMAVVEAILKTRPAPSPLEGDGDQGGSSKGRGEGVFAVARAMHDVLSSGVLTNDSIISRVSELAAGPAKRLAASAERARLMAKRLDERLLRLAVGDASIDATAGLDVTDAGVLVSVLVGAFGDGTVAALTKAGLKIESTSKPTRVVIGRIAVKHLGDLATCKHVRRVEAVRVR